jgi:hypothetical protein
MDSEPEQHVPEPYTQQEHLVERLQPESEIEDRLVRQIALCSVKLGHIEALLARAGAQLQRILKDAQDVPLP